MGEFIHLHCHGHNSLLDGLGSPTSWIEAAKSKGFSALALTDHASISGAVEFYKKAKEADIVPIIGCEFYCVDDPNRKMKKGESHNRYHLLVLAKTWKGLQSIFHALAIANKQFYYKPLLGTDQIFGFNDCIVSTACFEGILSKDDYPILVQRLHETYGEDLYLEIMPHLFAGQETVNLRAFELHQKFGIMPVATNDCHYPFEDDAETQEVLLAVQTAAKWTDTKRWKFDGTGFFLRDSGEMIEAFKPWIEKKHLFPSSFLGKAFRATFEIRDKCAGFTLPKLDYALPAIFEDEKKKLLQLCMKGWEKKIKGKIKDTPPYLERLKHELKVMTGIPGVVRYILMVYDLMDFARKNDILSGFGRGSVGGSLVALLLGIINVDPVANDLYFERFLRPDRIDMPDIDLDFGAVDRKRVIEYIEEKYGAKNVCHISTATEMQGRLAFKDVARVFGILPTEANHLSSFIDNEKTLEENFETIPELKAFAEKNPKIAKHASRLTGQVRAKGMHAGGIIISHGGFEDRGVLERRKENEMAINWTMTECDQFGLLKIDVLGLSNLSVLKDTAKLVKRHRGIDIDWHSIEAIDHEVLKQFGDGHTAGFFQFESAGITRLCRDLAPIQSFEELIHINALYRPGPLQSGMVESYKKRKRHEEEIRFNHSKEEEITSQTLGLPIFQEQIMALCVKLAGFSWPEADNVRKAIAKSKGAEALEVFRKQFVEGCEKETPDLPRSTAERMWDQIVKFGRYSFNKCICHDEKLFKIGIQPGQFHPTIGEMYKIKNDPEYAKATGHFDLHKKYKNYGYCYSLSLNDNKRLIKNHVIDIYFSGVLPVFKVTTQSGRTLRCTMNHKIPTSKGEKLLQNIKVGDYLFVKGRYEHTQYNYNLYERGEVPDNLPKKGEKGFQKRENGHSAIFFKIRDDKIKAIGVCEECGKKDIDRFELHHIDFKRTNNDPENLKLVCVSCHKKLHYAAGRTKMYEKGCPSVLDQIVSIEYVGKEECYDVEMADPYHTFVTGNGIVVCNSHSACYSYIAYLTAWAKHYYPTEFMAALLSSVTDESDQTTIYVADCKRMGLKIELPDINLSEIGFSITGGGALVPGFSSIKGVGEKATTAIMDARNEGHPPLFSNVQDFLTRTPRRTVNKKIIELLAFSGAFKTRTVKWVVENYPVLSSEKTPLDIKDEYSREEIETRRIQILPGIFTPSDMEREIRLDIYPDILDDLQKGIKGCTGCNLHKTMPDGPIPFAYTNKSRIMLVGDIPGPQEEMYGLPLAGKARKKVEELFKEVLAFPFNRLLITNIFNCRPATGKLPEDFRKNFDCARKWIDPLIKATKPEIILVMGNMAMEFFTGRPKGITHWNGKTEWSPKYGTLLLFSVSPGSMCMWEGRGEENQVLFKAALEKLEEYL